MIYHTFMILLWVGLGAWTLGVGEPVGPWSYTLVCLAAAINHLPDAMPRERK